MTQRIEQMAPRYRARRRVVAFLALVSTIGCQTWRQVPTPEPGTESQLGHVLVATASGPVVELWSAEVARDSVIGQQQARRDLPRVRTAIPANTVTSITRGTLNAPITIAGVALLASIVTTLSLVSANGFRHP